MGRAAVMAREAERHATKQQAKASRRPWRERRLWEKVDDVLVCAVIFCFLAAGVYAIASLLARFGVSDTMNEVGYVMLGFLVVAAVIEAIRAVRHRGVPPRWWVSVALAVAMPVFFLGAVAVATPPYGQWAFYVIVCLITSIVFQKMYASRFVAGLGEKATRRRWRRRS